MFQIYAGLMFIILFMFNLLYLLISANGELSKVRLHLITLSCYSPDCHSPGWTHHACQCPVSKRIWDKATCIRMGNALFMSIFYFIAKLCLTVVVSRPE